MTSPSLVQSNQKGWNRSLQITLRSRIGHCASGFEVALQLSSTVPYHFTEWQSHPSRSHWVRAPPGKKGFVSPVRPEAALQITSVSRTEDFVLLGTVSHNKLQVTLLGHYVISLRRVGQAYATRSSWVQAPLTGRYLKVQFDHRLTAQ